MGLVFMNNMILNVVYFGNNVKVLECICKKAKVKAIFCRPENNYSVLSLKKFAVSHQIPIKQPNKKELHKFSSYLTSLAPDLIIVCGYKYIIPSSIYDIPYLRTVNIHPSYLPAYRGQHVINWAILEGDKKTGVTLHYIDDGIDTGDIILQEEVPIDSNDDALTLHHKLYLKSCDVVSKLFEILQSGQSLPRIKQDDSKATYYPPRSPADGKINWDESGVKINDLIRSLVKPWPGSFCIFKNSKLIVWKSRFISSLPKNGINGEILDISTDFLTVCVKGGILLIEDYEVLHDYSILDADDLTVGDILK